LYYIKSYKYGFASLIAEKNNFIDKNMIFIIDDTGEKVSSSNKIARGEMVYLLEKIMITLGEIE